MADNSQSCRTTSRSRRSFCGFRPNLAFWRECDAVLAEHAVPVLLRVVENYLCESFSINNTVGWKAALRDALLRGEDCNWSCGKPLNATFAEVRGEVSCWDYFCWSAFSLFLTFISAHANSGNGESQKARDSLQRIVRK